jgi:uncharacterized protein
MWIRVSRFILKNKILLFILLAAITVFMGFHATRVEMSYEYSQLLPKKDPAFEAHEKFVSLFGEEGNLIVVAIQDEDFFALTHFEKWENLCRALSDIEGVENLLSVSNSYNLAKNTEEKKFEITRIFPLEIHDQQQLDSLAATFKKLPFYRNLLYNDSSDAYLLAITVNKDKMASKKREQLIRSIQRIGQQFEEDSGVKLHYSGLPYIRVVNSIQIRKEIYLFSFLALCICIMVLFLFFRSFKAVFFPVIIVLTGVVWGLGMLSLFGFKITLLTGMVPPLLIVIGIPNSIYMLNKFHHEYVSHGNKIKALQRVIIKIGNATFLTNLTTAAGFATFITVKSDILRQFGIIASLSIMGLFILSLLLIPIVFSLIEPPSLRHVKHLKNTWISGMIECIIRVTRNHRRAVYVVSLMILGAGIFGMTRIKSSGFMVDDIPESDPIYKDLKFFETNFDGLLPLEIMINTQKPRGVMQLSTFQRIEKLENELSEVEELSPPLSLLNLLKFSRQAFYNGNEAYYQLPNNREKDFIFSYASKGEENMNLLHSFLDSTRQITRVSFRMKDIGTKEMERFYNRFRTKIDSVFPNDTYEVVVTGSSVIHFMGTEYLLRSLFTSLGLAILLISAFMALMFSSWRMILLSLIPNVLPLVFTAALMGYAAIPIKASTILVFSIAFGISVDNTIHFLAKYRQELKLTNWDIRQSVILALRETGVSMLYTSVVLFFGFGIFSISGFGGTVAMGILVSLTLLVAATSNLVLLPSLLTGLERITTTKAFQEPLLHIYDEEEDIEPEKLIIENKSNE